MTLADQIVSFLSHNPDKRFTTESLASAMGIHDSWSMDSTLQKLSRTHQISQVAIPVEDGNVWGYRTLGTACKETVVL